MRNRTIPTLDLAAPPHLMRMNLRGPDVREVILNR